MSRDDANPRGLCYIFGLCLAGWKKECLVSFHIRSLIANQEGSHLIDYLFDLLDFLKAEATNREVLDLMDSCHHALKMNGKMLISNYSGNGSVIVMRIGVSVLSTVNDADPLT